MADVSNVADMIAKLMGYATEEIAKAQRARPGSAKRAAHLDRARTYITTAMQAAT